jgi:hypothetical protein
MDIHIKFNLLTDKTAKKKVLAPCSIAPLGTSSGHTIMADPMS